MTEPAGRTALTISVVIPHLNQPQMLARCLASLAAGRRQPDQIIVVDNGSTDMPEAICAAFPTVTLLSEPTPGPGPARNRGVAAAQGTILAFIDADCIADPGWLAAAEAALSDPTTEILGGDVRIALADPARVTMLEAYESIYAYRMDIYIARQGFTGTGNLIVRRRVFDSVGPFGGLDVAEDRDWGQRATACGHALRYVAAMRVYHPARSDFAGLYAKWDRHSAHDYQEACARAGGRLRFAIKAMAIAFSPLAELPTITVNDRISGLRSRVLAFVALARIRAYRARIMVWLVTGGDAAVLAGQWNREKPTG
ncbi:glycosyltransferase [Tabrizicola sp. WMC-M-20]|nr:glycosyltransferase [Tabrizicola sp. WMC-M-20]